MKKTPKIIDPVTEISNNIENATENQAKNYLYIFFHPFRIVFESTRKMVYSILRCIFTCILAIYLGFRSWIRRLLGYIIKSIVFFEKTKSFQFGLLCEYKFKKNLDLDYEHLILYPVRNLPIDDQTFVLEKTTIDEQTEHIILFKSHGTSIRSMAEGFRIDAQAVNFNFAFYIPEYKDNYFKTNISIPQKKINEKAKKNTERNFVKSESSFDHLAECIEDLAIKIYAKYKKRPHLMGFSIGCAMLLESTLKNNIFKKNIVNKVILCAPFYSLTQYIDKFWPLSLIIKGTVERNFPLNNFEALTRILSRKEFNTINQSLVDQYVKRFVLFHGEIDNVIPCTISENFSSHFKIPLHIFRTEHCTLLISNLVWLEISKFIRDEEISRI